MDKLVSNFIEFEESNYLYEKEIHGFIINKSLEGLTTSSIEKASLKISQTGQIILDNIKVPKKTILPKYNFTISIGNYSNCN